VKGCSCGAFSSRPPRLCCLRHRLSYDVAAACPRSEVRERRNPVTQGYINDQIARANHDHYDAIVILLDTPAASAPR
jgi:hypothetical protein